MRALRGIEGIVLGAIMLAMSFAYTFNVAVRELAPAFAPRLAWIEELCLFGLVWMIFLGLGLGLEGGRHIAMRMVLTRMPPARQRAAKLVINLAGLAFSAYLAKIGVDITIFVANSGQTSPAAQRWADMLTTKYEALAAQEPIFAELQNVMDLSVAAALIAQENLAQKAGHSLPLLLDSKQLPHDELEAVQRTDSVVSMIQKGSQWIISASGGVQIDSWAAARKQETSPEVAQARTHAAAPAQRWWWD